MSSQMMLAIGVVLSVTAATGADPLDFTWAPPSPEIGEVTTFEIIGVPAVDIDAADWSFGGLGCDGSTSFDCTAGPTSCDSAAFEYASAGPKTVTITATINGVQQVPVVHEVVVLGSGSCSTAASAGLTVDPVMPDIGEVALFTVSGFAGPIRSLWDFGEHGCDGQPQFQTCDPVFTNCQEVGFRFASPGEKNVAVVVENPFTGAVMDTANIDFTVSDQGSCGGGSERYVMQSFYVDGAAGSIFRHEMELFNPGATDVTIRLDWLPQNQDNTVPPVFGFVSVPAHGGVRIDNVLDEVLGLARPAIGAVRLAGVPDLIRIDNLGLNDGPSGTFGWNIPTGGADDGLASGESGFFLGLGQDDDVRTNLTCDNWSAVPVVIDVELVDASGTALDTTALPVQPYSVAQMNQVFADYAPVDGYLRISHSHPVGIVACVASVGMNTTSDFRSEPQRTAPNPELTWLLPRAIHDGQTTTDLVLFAPSGPAQFQVDFLPTGQDNTIYQSVDFVLGDQQQVRIDAAIDTLFSASGSGSLRVVASSGSLLATALERTLAPGSERLRLARIRPVDEQLSANHPASIIHLTEDAAHRTDLGVANTSSESIDVVFELRDATGPVLGRLQTQLPPFSHAELAGVFAAVGHPDVGDGRARVITPTDGGSFLAYAVVTDLDTLDSWEMPAEALPAALLADGFESGDLSRWSAGAP